MKTNNSHTILAGSALALLLGTFSGSVLADTYQIKLTNVTAGEAFTPRLAITHKAGKLWTLGAPAIEQLVAVAEGGDLSPLMTLLGGLAAVTDMQTGDGLLMPGESQTVTIDGVPGSLFSMVFMLIPTNDGFSGANAFTLPESGSMTWTASVYDAGSETNDEVCTNIPGPFCGGAGASPDDSGEGFVHIHPGIHGGADLMTSTYNWNNPAAVITITKM